MRKKRSFRKKPRRRVRRPGSARSANKGYRIALEILLVAAVLQGAFFIINSYKKAKPTAVKAVKVEVVKPSKPRPKPVEPKIEVARVEVPKPKPKAKEKPPAKAVPRPEPEIKVKPKVKVKPKPAVIPAPVKKPRAPAGSQGKIAVVFDDWGYSLNNMRIVKQIKCPFTAAVLPNLRYSKKVAEELHKQGIEIILHLPMESQEKLGMEKNTILISMDKEKISEIIEQDLDNIVYAKGVNNHMGSRATQDPRVMEDVFKELKKKRLYFLDSSVTPRSACPELAEKMKMPFIKRDIFLDNKSEPEYISRQVHKLKTKAKERGQAVGIGHDRRNTLEVLSKEMPKLEEEGYEFVFVSELID